MPASPEGIRRALDPHPMPNLQLFSEQAKKRVGMTRASGANPIMLETFRVLALELGEGGRTVSIDDRLVNNSNRYRVNFAAVLD